jgi:hypothetical protein
MSNNLQAELAQPQLQKGARAKCSMAAFPKMFTFRFLPFLIIMSCSAPLQTVALPPCLPLYVTPWLSVSGVSGNRWWERNGDEENSWGFRYCLEVQN